ncbi:MAG: hypothetical protein KJ579_02960 [Verrucomicrobia bacterium]|nr:hypothetical protein [Verrucomicrobiota bacterium]
MQGSRRWTCAAGLAAMKAAVVLGVLSGIPSGRAQSFVALPFDDAFNNGAQADSDILTSFWNSLGQYASGSLVESGGNWVFTVGPHGTSDGTPFGGWPTLSVMSRTTGDLKYFDMFDRNVGIQVRGVNIEYLAGNGPATGTVRTVAAGYLRFGFSAQPSTTYNALDSIAILLRGDGRIMAGAKSGFAGTDPEAHSSYKALDFSLPGNAPATGFDFWMDDPASGIYSNFNLCIYYGDNSTCVTNVKFKTPLTAEAWGTTNTVKDGKAWLNVTAQRYALTDPQDSIRFTIGSLSVAPSLPPALLLLGARSPFRFDPSDDLLSRAGLRPGRFEVQRGVSN